MRLIKSITSLFHRGPRKQDRKRAGRPRPDGSLPASRPNRRTRLRRRIHHAARRVNSFIGRLPLPESRGCWIVIAVTVPLSSATGLIIAGMLSEEFQCWLIGNESGSATIRNVGLIIVALTAFPLAIWRGIIADKQSAATHRQADMAQLGLRNERYQRGADMLGNKELSIRLGGIYALQRLAEEDPEGYHLHVMRLFCSFVRHPTEDLKHEAEAEEKMGAYGRRDDVEAVMRAIRERPESSVRLEFSGPFHLDFQGANLGRLYNDVLGYFSGSGSFIHADFSEAKLVDAVLSELDFENARFVETDLSNAFLARYSNLNGATFAHANLSGTAFSEVRGLTQAQLDQACAYVDNPPTFDDVWDADTGEQLVWRGGQGEPVEG